MSALSKAFKELCGVCRPRSDQDMSNMEATVSRLWRVFGEYPEAVAVTATDLWPRRSDFFPTEKELRALLDEVAAQAAIDAAARQHVGGGRYNQPVGNTVEFVQRVTHLRGADYVKSWLAGGITAQFSANVVYLTGIGFERLSKDVGALADQCGVRLVRDKDVSEMLKRYCDQNGLKFPPKGKRS